MEEQGYTITEFTYGSFVNGLVKCGEISAAVNVLRNMEEKGCIPKMHSYSSVISGLCKHGLVNQAIDLFSEIIVKGKVPNIATFNSLIHGICHVHHLRQATQFLDLMIGYNMRPNVTTFSILIAALCRKGDQVTVSEAEDLLKEMLKLGIQPNVVTYTSLIYGYCVRGKMSRALHWFRCIPCKPNLVTYNTIVKGYLVDQDTTNAIKLVTEMMEAGISGNTITTQLVKKYLSHQNMELSDSAMICKLIKTANQQEEDRHYCKVPGMGINLERHMSLAGVSDKNVNQLKKLNTVLFPVLYKDNYYAESLASADFTKLAYYSDICVGAIACRLEKTDGGVARVHIMTLGVLAPYRGRGIGATLLRHVTDLAKKENISEVYLHVQSNDEDATNFFQKKKFEITDIIQNYYPNITGYYYVLTKLTPDET